ncbi:MAG: GlsB/YeaQ/YmgE family stress response membrane protein [Chloroflexota bacterium]|nr:GlsB/YeaQ/YmgE family stress response membrane protein [Chloroflexota bacterium]
MDFIGSIVASPFICIGWIIIGAIAGALARSLTKSTDRPFIMDMILGIVGAFIGGLIGSALGLLPQTDGGLERVLVNLVVATIGAILLIGIGRMARGR